MQDTRQIRQLNAMALGFGIGSSLFAVGALMSVLQLNLVVNGVIYALGAVCFTTAAAVQLRAAADHPAPSRVRDPDWMSAAIQLAGTLFFNVMTIRALALSLDSPTASYDRVWNPDVLGSLLFLISSWIAWHPVARRHRHRLLVGRSRLICLANMLGSMFFAVSAVGAAMLSDGSLRNEKWDNWGTFFGAVAFLVGAIALRPTATEMAAAR